MEVGCRVNGRGGDFVNQGLSWFLFFFCQTFEMTLRRYMSLYNGGFVGCFISLYSNGWTSTLFALVICHCSVQRI